MPAGRPTKYDKEMCNVVIEQMKVGASKVEVCAELDICYETFMNYQAEHKEFSESVKRGEKLSEAWWLREGRLNLKDREFNYTGWYMNMKNRHGWSDKQELKHSGEITHLTDDQIDSRIAELIGKAGVGQAS